MIARIFATTGPCRRVTHIGFGLAKPGNPFGGLVNRRYVSHERNVVQSPFGTVDIPVKNVTEYIFEGYEQYADKPAVTCGATKRSYNYGMTYEMTKRMARGLLSQKGCAMRKTDVLGLLLPNIPEFVPALHGGLLAGLSVTFANPLYTAEEVCRQFENAGVTAIVTLPMLLPVAEMFRSKVKQYKGTICVGGRHDLDKNIYGFEQFLMENHKSELPEIDCHKTAILPYSSGTTGLPKGVELSHYNLVANLAQGSHPSISKYYQPEYADRKETILTIPPYFHIYGLNAILHSVLKSKNHIVSIPRKIIIFLMSVMNLLGRVAAVCFIMLSIVYVFVKPTCRKKLCYSNVFN